MNPEKTKKSRVFSFKAFSLSDSNCGMKIGTDGVLLGSFASTYPAEKVLDIGTGCGLIALMVAQKTRAEVHAIDIDHDSLEQAAENFRKSPWHFQLFDCSLQEFSSPGGTQYDLIVCNPPFFENSLKSDNNSRSLARHNDTLKPDELFYYSRNLLSETGVLITIFPFITKEQNDLKAISAKLYPVRNLIIKPKPDHNPVRLISVYSKNPVNEIITEVLSIENKKRHEFTPEYKELTKDFHPFL
ncbi:MAG: methyltransferase [Bacteroidales bacterium]|nr:methyltransferase [Bacteroidales bacterium]